MMASAAGNNELADALIPLVSVIMPAYNAERYIRESIESVLNQNYKRWELIIVDDCSQDSTVHIVREYAERDPRIRLIRSKENLGPASARNIGLEAGAGSYLALLDSDDLWLPEKITKQINFMLEHKADISCTAYRRMSADGSRVYKLIKAPSVITYNVLLRNTCIANLTAIIRRDVVEEVRFRDIGHEDYAFWLEMLKQGLAAHFLDVDLARYRVVNTSVSSKKMRVLKWTWFIYREREKFSIYRSFWYISNYAVRALLKRLSIY